VPDQQSPTNDEEPSDLGPEYWQRFIEDIKNVEWGDGPHLISVDELRAAGALDVPASWRKSLGVERGLLFDLSDDDTPAGEQAASEDDEGE
jgi:hypothetical protein